VLGFRLSALGILKRGEKGQRRVVRLESANENLLVQFVRAPILSSQDLLRCLYEISSIIDSSPIPPSWPTEEACQDYSELRNFACPVFGGYERPIRNIQGLGLSTDIPLTEYRLDVASTP
jgi:hypothetical protein